MAYSFDTTVASGSTPNVTVPFPYINTSDVHIKLDGVEVDGSLFSWVADSIIQLPSTPASGTSIRVYRQTDATQLSTVYSTPAVLDHRDWNRVLQQMLYVTQEAFDLGDANNDALSTVIDYINSAMAATQESAEAAAISASGAAGYASTASSASTAATSAVSGFSATVTAATDTAVTTINGLADTAYSDIGDAVDVAFNDIVNQTNAGIGFLVAAKDTALSEVAASSAPAAADAATASAAKDACLVAQSAASGSALLSSYYATYPNDTDIPGGNPGERSALIWASKAKQNATTKLINTKTASYTLALTDLGMCVRMDVATANNLTVPPSSAVAFAIGTVIEWRQAGAGKTTLVPGVGVTLNTRVGLNSLGQHAGGRLHKVGADEWDVYGELEA